MNTMKTELPNMKEQCEVFWDVLAQAKHDMMDLVEEVSAVLTHAREGMDASNNTNLQGALMDAKDAIDCLNRIEAQASATAAEIAKHVEYYE